jgi:hypothetical protein
MKSTTFWDVMPCGMVEVYTCFSGISAPHIHSRRVSQASNLKEANTKQGQPRVVNLVQT